MSDTLCIGEPIAPAQLQYERQLRDAVEHLQATLPDDRTMWPGHDFALALFALAKVVHRDGSLRRFRQDWLLHHLAAACRIALTCDVSAPPMHSPGRVKQVERLRKRLAEMSKSKASTAELNAVVADIDALVNSEPDANRCDYATLLEHVDAIVGELAQLCQEHDKEFTSSCEKRFLQQVVAQGHTPHDLYTLTDRGLLPVDVHETLRSPHPVHQGRGFMLETSLGRPSVDFATIERFRQHFGQRPERKHKPTL